MLQTVGKGRGYDPQVLYCRGISACTRRGVPILALRENVRESTPSLLAAFWRTRFSSTGIYQRSFRLRGWFRLIDDNLVDSFPRIQPFCRYTCPSCTQVLFATCNTYTYCSILSLIHFVLSPVRCYDPVLMRGSGNPACFSHIIHVSIEQFQALLDCVPQMPPPHCPHPQQ